MSDAGDSPSSHLVVIYLWDTRLPRGGRKRARASTAENKQKGNHGNHAREVFFAAFVVGVQRHLQAWHMYYSVSSAFERSRVNDTFLVPVACGWKTFLITIAVRYRFRPCVARA